MTIYFPNENKYKYNMKKKKEEVKGKRKWRQVEWKDVVMKDAADEEWVSKKNKKKINSIKTIFDVPSLIQIFLLYHIILMN